MGFVSTRGWSATLRRFHPSADDAATWRFVVSCQWGPDKTAHKAPV